MDHRKQYTLKEMRNWLFKLKIAWKILRGKFTVSSKRNCFWIWNTKKSSVFTLLLYPFEPAEFNHLEMKEHNLYYKKMTEE